MSNRNENTLFIEKWSPDFQPPCECTGCNRQYRIQADYSDLSWFYRSSLDNSQAAIIIQTHLEDILQSHSLLREKCNKYGDLILTRWKKWSRDKRAACLLKADPEMHQRRWVSTQFEQILDARGSRKILLCPYMNVESLKGDYSKLVGILYRRCNTEPQDWVPFDDRVIECGWGSRFFDIHFNSQWVVMYGTRYRELVSYEENAAHRRDIMGFPRAQLLFEAQSGLYGHLCRIVDAILETIWPIPVHRFLI